MTPPGPLGVPPPGQRRGAAAAAAAANPAAAAQPTSAGEEEGRGGMVGLLRGLRVVLRRGGARAPPAPTAVRVFVPSILFHHWSGGRRSHRCALGGAPWGVG